MMCQASTYICLAPECIHVYNLTTTMYTTTTTLLYYSQFIRRYSPVTAFAASLDLTMESNTNGVALSLVKEQLMTALDPVDKLVRARRRERGDVKNRFFCRMVFGEGSRADV